MSSVQQIPAFDNTLGALYIGSNVATILYGVICLQTFIYITSTRGQNDKWWLKNLVYLLFLVDSANQLAMTAAMYKFLVSDYLQPALLSSGGPGSGEVFTFAMSCSGAIVVLLIQLFFCWRIWVISMASLRFEYRLLFAGLAVSLALLSYATSMDLAVTGFIHRILTANTSSFILAYKLATSSRIAFDVMVTTAMTISLQRARSRDGENTRTDHIITLLTLFTVNTNLITTCLSITELATFLALPKATVYGGVGFLTSKTYLNSFLAVLNSREYLREQLDDKTGGTSTSTSTSSRRTPIFAVLPQYKRSAAEGSSTAASAPGSYELSRMDDSSNFKRNVSNEINPFGVKIPPLHPDVE